MTLVACLNCPAIFEARAGRLRCTACEQLRHRARSRIHMRERRASDPVMRELERFAVRQRMRVQREAIGRQTKAEARIERARSEGMWFWPAL